jgi:hypothetical protein
VFLQRGSVCQAMRHARKYGTWQKNMTIPRPRQPKYTDYRRVRVKNFFAKVATLLSIIFAKQHYFSDKAAQEATFGPAKTLAQMRKNQ